MVKYTTLLKPLVTHLPHRHCAVSPAVHTWYSAGQTLTLRASLWNKEPMRRYLKWPFSITDNFYFKLTSFPSLAQVLPADEPNRTCCSRCLRSCFWKSGINWGKVCAPWFPWRPLFPGRWLVQVASDITAPFCDNIRFWYITRTLQIRHIQWEAVFIKLISRLIRPENCLPLYTKLLIQQIYRAEYLIIIGKTTCDWCESSVCKDN